MTASVATRISPRGRPQLSIDVRGEDDLRSPGVQKTPLNGDNGVIAMDFETEEDTSSTTTYEYDDEEEANNNNNTNNSATDDDVDVLVLEAGAEPTEKEEEAEAVVASPSSGDMSINTEIEMITTESGSSASSNTVENTATAADLASPLANFITQTDASGKASTPRNAPMNSSLTQAMTVASPSPSSTTTTTSSTAVVDIHYGDQDIAMTDVACETIITAFGRMCCCIDPAISTTTTAATSSSSLHKGSMTTRGRVANEDVVVGNNKNKDCCISSAKVATPSTAVPTTLTTATATPSNHPIGYSTRGHDATPLLEGDSALYSNPNNIKLLPSLDSVLDAGKKCLVLDLDETLVHSSFRAVKGADFVLSVQVRFVLLYFLSYSSLCFFFRHYIY